MRAVEIADRARTLWTDDDRAWASSVGGAGGRRRALRRRCSSPRRAQFALRSARQPRQGAAADRARLALAALGGRGGGGLRSWPGSSSTASAATQRINVLAPPVLLLRARGTSRSTRCSPAGFVVRYGEPSHDGSVAAGGGPARRTPARRHGAARSRDDPLPQAISRPSPTTGRAGGSAVRGAGRAHPAPGGGRARARRHRGPVPARARLRVPRHMGEHVPRCVGGAPHPGRRSTRRALASRHSGSRRGAARGDARAGERERRAVAASHGGDVDVRSIVVPRVVLALGSGWRRTLSRHAPAGRRLEQPYFRAPAARLCTMARSACDVVPYSFTPDAAAPATMLAALLGRGWAATSPCDVAPAVAYGDEETFAATGVSRPRVVLVSSSTAPPRRSAKRTAPSSRRWRRSAA